MKIRIDFVTNSSSSSFLIEKKNLTAKQIKAIRNHGEVAKRLNLYCWEESWNIKENDYSIAGDTWMDNFSMREFLKIIGITSSVQWGENPFELLEEDDIKDWESIVDEIED